MVKSKQRISVLLLATTKHLLKIFKIVKSIWLMEFIMELLLKCLHATTHAEIEIRLRESLWRF